MDFFESEVRKRTIKIGNQSIYNVIKGILSKISFKTVLEVGCGSGFFLKELRKYECECYGLDIRDPRDIVRKDVLLEDICFLRADGHSIPFKKDSFDLVTILEVIEHMPQPQKFFNEASRVLKDGGYLLIGTPNFWRFSSILGRIKMEYSQPNPKKSLKALKDTNIIEYLARGHEKEFTPRELKNMIKEVKFQVITIEYAPFNISFHHLVNLICQRYIKSLIRQQIINYSNHL